MIKKTIITTEGGDGCLSACKNLVIHLRFHHNENLLRFSRRRKLDDVLTTSHIREVKFDVYGKRQTANFKLLPSVFTSLYSRIKIFVFAVNSERHFSIFV